MQACFEQSSIRKANKKTIKETHKAHACLRYAWGVFVCLCMDSSCTDSFGMRKLEVEYHHQLAMSVLLVKTAAANCIAMAASSIHHPVQKKEKKEEEGNKT